MYRRFHDRFGTAGVVLGVIALIAAMGGTALAASKLNGTQKKEVEKIAKKFAGKPGAPGTNGTNGANGAAGEKGAKGDPGTNGTPGTNGENVNVSAYTGTECEEAEGEEGAEFTNGTGTAYACNGKEGSPWTAGGTLPSGATETGAWLIPSGGSATAISFPIPLAQPVASRTYVPQGGSIAQATGTGDLTLNSKLVKNVTTGTGSFIAGAMISGSKIPGGTVIATVISATELELSQRVGVGGTATGVALTAKLAPSACEDSAHPGLASPENPEASSGALCIYSGGGEAKTGAILTPASDNFNPGSSIAGVTLLAGAGVEAGALGFASGTWAVTAP